jgi:hypothetical protein
VRKWVDEPIGANADPSKTRQLADSLNTSLRHEALQKIAGEVLKGARVAEIVTESPDFPIQATNRRALESLYPDLVNSYTDPQNGLVLGLALIAAWLLPMVMFGYLLRGIRAVWTVACPAHGPGAPIVPKPEQEYLGP